MASPALPTVLETANLHWLNENTPVSRQYNDVYFSSTDGYAESHYVYIKNNAIEARFKALEKSHFTLAETGFGTGLNFLQTWELWSQHKKNFPIFFCSQNMFWSSISTHTKFPH